MRDYIEGRVTQIARHMVNTGCTVRSAAEVFCVSKSTIHKDISTVLRQIDPELYRQVDRVLQKNKKERHIRGGLATKRKYNTDAGK